MRQNFNNAAQTQIPQPKVGMVVNYEYLWARQYLKGFKENEYMKVRPCAILAVVEGKDETTVYVSPMTHTAPFHPHESLLLPQETKKRLGLDQHNSWLMVNEVNKFTWPGEGLRPVYRDHQRRWCFGMLPEAVLLDARTKLKAFNANKKLLFVPRDEQMTCPAPAMRAG